MKLSNRSRISRKIQRQRGCTNAKLKMIRGELGASNWVHVSSVCWTPDKDERKLSFQWRNESASCLYTSVSSSNLPKGEEVSSTGNPVEVNTPHVPATTGRRGSRAQSLVVDEVGGLSFTLDVFLAKLQSLNGIEQSCPSPKVQTPPVQHA